MQHRVTVLLPVAAIVGLNLLAHFLPFERVSLASDDLQILWIPPAARAEVIHTHLTTTRRPLEISYFLLHWFAGNNKLLWVALVFLTSSLFAGSVYFLTAEIIGNRALNLMSSVFFLLLPNKEQLYHHLIYAHLNFVYAVTAAGLALFFTYLRNSNRLCLLTSLVCYTISLFWYELGFFLPLILVAAAALYGRKKLWACLLFSLPVFFYLFRRSGHPDPVPLNYLWPNLLVTAPNLYLGRQMIKETLYGLARFPFIESPWIFIVLLGDGLILWGSFLWLRKGSLPQVPLRALLLSAVLGILFLIPASLVPYGPLGRHTALASIGFSILAIAALRFLFGPRPLFLALLLGVGLAVSQGTAWNQAVSCRMNNAILEAIQEKKGSILEADRVLIDQYSFAQRIPYTWVKDPHNQLDTYWGVDGLVGTAFCRLVPGIVGKKIPVSVIRSPLQTEGEMFAFQVYNTDHYQFEQARVPRKGSVLIDYAAVYPNGFNNGKR